MSAVVNVLQKTDETNKESTLTILHCHHSTTISGKSLAGLSMLFETTKQTY